MRWALVVALLAGCGDNLIPDCADASDTCRDACAYGSGDGPALTLRDHPIGSEIPIDTIIMVMQENRTFDHYFSSLTVPGQTVDGASPDITNPDPLHPGQTISRFHQPAYCFDDPAESWDEVHREIDGGALDAFTTINAQDDPEGDPTGARTMGYYDETDLPYYYALARTFAISDRHFSSVQANTWPNRLFFMAGTSYGVTTDNFPATQFEPNGDIIPNLFTRMSDAGVTWAFYVQDVPTLAILYATYGKYTSHVLTYDQFFTDAAAGKLPQVVYVEGTDFLKGLSPNEDPPADMQVGELMVSQIIAATTSSPQWPHTALFLTYDEQGGFYDHVPPPAACAPDDLPAQLETGDFVAGFDQYGLRVPLIAVSPYAKRGYVSHVVTDHTSLTRFVEARFNLGALTHRDANAVPPYDLFDFGSANLSVPQFPAAVVDPAQQAYCGSAYPPQN